MNFLMTSFLHGISFFTLTYDLNPILDARRNNSDEDGEIWSGKMLYFVLFMSGIDVVILVISYTQTWRLKNNA